MQIRNFNHTEAPPAAAPAEHASAHTARQNSAESPGPQEDGQASAEIALLRARIEHLELVVETARSLMTSNQERLLRRLHDLPHEMMALTARLARHMPEQEADAGRFAAARRVQ
jgi:hypothetical protein